jgi:predicted ATPase
MRLPLRSFRLQNFKAVRDSGTVSFTPLTVFIGNNGSGKSSLIEGMEMVRDIVREGLDEAMFRWRGFESVWNKAVPHSLKETKSDRYYRTNPMRFVLEGTIPHARKNSDVYRHFWATSEITTGGNQDELFFLYEKLTQSLGIEARRVAERTKEGKVTDNWGEGNAINPGIGPAQSVLSAETSLNLWRFLRLNPEEMMVPRPLHRVAGFFPLATDGANITEYLRDIYQRDPKILTGIIETMQAVLPYAKDFQTIITSELERTIYLQVTEGDFKLPGWVLSTGTLRILALLAVLRHPEPPPLVVIEEVENGLDPRTIHLLIEEIRDAVQSGTTQVILTTHSPYLLDLVPLSSIVLVERVDGQPTFYRPTDDEELVRWNAKFAPGQLYTMGRLRQKRK